MLRAMAAALAAVALLASGCATWVDVPPSPSPGLEPAEQTLLDAVNELREARSLSRLTVDGRLQRAARERTQNMADFNYIDHGFEREGHRPFAEWIQWYYPNVAGEILVKRTPDLTAAQAIELWLGSPAHRDNLLNPDWTTVGVELTANYGTVDFGRQP